MNKRFMEEKVMLILRQYKTVSKSLKYAAK